MKAPIKSAWCCKSLVWFGACKPLESHWPAKAKCAVRAWRGGWGYMVRLALYLMHHLSLRCWFNRQRSNNEVTFFDSHANWQSERESWMMASSSPRRTEKKNQTVASTDSNTDPPVGTSSLHLCLTGFNMLHVFTCTVTDWTAIAGILYTNSQVM